MSPSATTLGPEAPTLTEANFTFRDLNKNGKLDPYEDSRLPIDERIEDLLTQMALSEKAGLMFHTMIGMNEDGTLAEELSMFNHIRTSELVAKRLLNHFNVLQAAQPAQMAAWHNAIQKLAEQTRLGIPVTISSDPRHSFSNNPGASFMASHFSQWPEPIGLAATDDADLVQQFAGMARQEYLAVGIRVALHPMADLATEPRWGRNNGTFGEDAALSSKMLTAYITGFQGTILGPNSVACMTKHFPGGGPQMNGEDAHFSYGKEQVYPGNNFNYHLQPFEAAFAAGTAQIMPYYGQPIGLDLEEVGFGFNKQVITGLLRETYQFDGVVCTDWKLLTPMEADGEVMIEAKCWGVEDMSVEERAKKAIEAGVDQFGGEACPEVIIELVESGQISQARLDQSVRRILRDKFKLGLFDNPYLDESKVEQVVGNETFRKAGNLAQRKSIVLLKNTETKTDSILPLSGKPKLYLENVDPVVAAEYGQVVSSVTEADFAILRLATPYEPREGFLEKFFHAGNLDFNDEEKARILNIMSQVPTIIDIYLERGAVMPEIAAQSVGLLANFGASDTAVLDVIFGRFNPMGKLPFEMPSSMEAVQAQKEDVPYDSENPLYSFGHGLSY